MTHYLDTDHGNRQLAAPHADLDSATNARRIIEHVRNWGEGYLGATGHEPVWLQDCIDWLALTEKSVGLDS